MAAALQAAQASESRFRALAQMIRDGWPDDRIIALGRTLYPDARQFAGIDNYLILIKDQYEQAGTRMPLRRLVAPAFGDESSITFIGVTNVSALRIAARAIGSSRWSR